MSLQGGRCPTWQSGKASPVGKLLSGARLMGGAKHNGLPLPHPPLRGTLSQERAFENLPCARGDSPCGGNVAAGDKRGALMAFAKQMTEGLSAGIIDVSKSPQSALRPTAPVAVPEILYSLFALQNFDRCHSLCSLVPATGGGRIALPLDMKGSLF